MKLFKSILIAVTIWTLGVLSFTVSFFVPVLDDSQLQANLILFLAIGPIVWFGSWLYYRNGLTTHGLQAGLFFFGMAALLDALVTVPLLVVPQGGSHLTFFSDPGFWAIGLEFVLTTLLYWHVKVRRRSQEFMNQSK